MEKTSNVIKSDKMKRNLKQKHTKEPTPKKLTTPQVVHITNIIKTLKDLSIKADMPIDLLAAGCTLSQAMDDTQRGGLYSMIKWMKENKQQPGYILSNVMHDINGLKALYLDPKNNQGFCPRFTGYIGSPAKPATTPLYGPTDIELTPEVRKQLRAANKTDSEGLFKYAWRKIRQFHRDSEIADIQALYSQIVSEAVNNPKSRFYIYG